MNIACNFMGVNGTPIRKSRIPINCVHIYWKLSTTVHVLKDKVVVYKQIPVKVCFKKCVSLQPISAISMLQYIYRLYYMINT